MKQDVSRWYPDLTSLIKVILVEAGPRILGSFDATLVDYYSDKLKAKGIDVRTGTAVTKVEERGGGSSYSYSNEPHSTVAVFSDQSEHPFGMMVWSAGLAPVNLVTNMRAVSVVLVLC